MSFIVHMAWLLTRNISIKTFIFLTYGFSPWFVHHFPIHGGSGSRWLGCPRAAVLRVVTMETLTSSTVICPRLARDLWGGDKEVMRDNTM